MLWGNVIFFISAAAVIFWLRSQPVKASADGTQIENSAIFEKWDWVMVAIFLLFASWMMFSTFNVTEGVYHIGHHQFPDFGATVSIMQSFAEGRNFPTEYPHFAGERIRYHFLFYFQAGNLQYLGLDAALSNNILSVLSLTSLMALIMTLGYVLFNSRAAGRIGAVLFFFHGSLAFIPFLYQHKSFPELWAKLSTMTQFLSSGLPYRGEDWGVWSQNVFLNQRHLSSSIGIVLAVIVLLIVRYRQFAVASATVRENEAKDRELISMSSPEIDDSLDVRANAQEAESDDEQALVADSNESDEILELDGSSDQGRDELSDGEIVEGALETEQNETDEVDDNESYDEKDEEEDHDHDEEEENEEEHLDETDEVVRESNRLKDVETVSKWSWLGKPETDLAPFILSGILLGLLPLWNGAIFTSAFVILALLFVFFPMKRQMLIMGVITAVFALPQIYFLKSGAREAGYSMLYFGYIIDNGTFVDVLYYLMFTFGFKWLLIAIALYFADGVQRKFFIAVSALIAVTFCFRFSEELLINHKFLNVWLVMANVFVAYAIVKLWNLGSAVAKVPLRVLTVILIALITIGGLIDLVPIKNSYSISMKHDGDRLVEWVQANTEPKSIFISHRYINHQILLAGRLLFYGDPYYSWGTGYDNLARDVIYRKIFEGQDPAEVFRLLKENNISYVAIDDVLRNGRFFATKPNEALFRAYFKLVFDDTERQYANLKIYEVPDQLGEPDPTVQLSEKEGTAVSTPGVPATDAFTGGVGAAFGQFEMPRGIVADNKGDFYVSDTKNARIQKFDSAGKFLISFGSSGTDEGQMKEPNGIAIDDSGNIFVTDAFNHKLMKFDPTGKFIKEWTPEGGFYGPRDIVFGPNKQLYIVDQGRTRIARFDPATESFTVWGSGGSGESQFNDPTGIAIGGDRVYVADYGNQRVQVFDLNGTFVGQFPVPVWNPTTVFYPDIVYDDVAQRLYVTGGETNQVLAFDLEGQPVTGHPAEGSSELTNPSALIISETKAIRRLLVLNTGSGKVTAFELGAKKAK